MVKRINTLNTTTAAVKEAPTYIDPVAKARARVQANAKILATAAAPATKAKATKIVDDITTPPQATTKLTTKLVDAGVTAKRTVADAWARAQCAFDEALEISGEVSIKRRIASFLLATITVCGIWYLAAPLIMALMAMSTYGFLGFVLAVFGFIATWYVAAKAGQLVYNVVMASTIERGAVRAWGAFKSMFDRGVITQA